MRGTREQPEVVLSIWGEAPTPLLVVIQRGNNVCRIYYPPNEGGLEAGKSPDGKPSRGKDMLKISGDVTSAV